MSGTERRRADSSCSPLSLPPASITGSAVCAFYMDDIEKAFGGKFKEQRNSESVWTPVPDEQVPKPRWGTDAPASGLFPRQQAARGD